MTYLRTKPSLTYSGLTVVLSNPSRFDKVRLLTAGGGHVLNDFCLRPELNVMQCDVRVADDPSPLLPNTKCLIVLGEYAMHKLLPATRQNTLNEMRGSLQQYQGLPAIPSFYPQDAADPKNFEKDYNEAHMVFADEDEGSENDEEDGKTHGRTDRKNYAFWMRADIKKAKWILKNGLPPIEPEPQYVNNPSSQDLIEVLSTTKDCFMDFDIETDYEEQNLQCFSFTFDGRVVYNVPVLDYNYKPAYGALPQILRALSCAIKNNTLVAHNGACFDFLVLPYKYRIPVYNVFDTMCAMHRCFPTVEKSLGHCFTGESLVDTLCGKVAIKDLVGKKDFTVWSWKNGNPFPAKVNNVFKTKEKTSIVRVHLWRKTNNGEGFNYEKTYIDCTPEHLFLVDDKWVKAEDLSNGVKLTRLRIHYGKEYKQYDRIVYKNSNGEDVRERVHKYVFECLFWKTNKYVHHVDEDKHNNEPNNLKELTEKEHNTLHMSLLHKKKDITSCVVGTFKNGITGQWDILKKETLEKLYNSGMSQAEIAKIYNTTQASIRLLLKKHEIKIRSQKEGQRLFYAKNKNCTVLGVEYLKDLQDVYCMEVEDTHCFSVNNVIVHNCTSYWTWQQFHKDEDSRGYRTPEQMKQRMAYCGKDVFTMHLIRKAIMAYAKTVPGLEHSIATVMKQIVPYIATTLQGIGYDETLRQSMRAENDALMEQYLRMIRILIGETGLLEVQSCLKGKAKAFPGSNKQCVQYFHNILGYPIVHRSKPDKNGVRNPSLAKQAMFKLRLKHNNPVIDICNLYRGVKLETTTPLGFYPWKDDNNKIMPYETNTII